MMQKFSERIVYGLNFIGTIALCLVGLLAFEQTDKVGTVFIGLILLLVYFITLSRTFYLTNIVGNGELSEQFRRLSLIPFLGVIPNVLVHFFLLTSEYTNKSLAISIGGFVFISVTIWNFIIKNK